MNIFITGGAGFIGSALIRHILTQGADRVLNLDKLSYASNLDSLASVAGNTHYEFVQGDIADRPLVDACLNRFQPDVIIHLAAETHVDRSIDSPAAFIHTNILGSFQLLEACRHYWRSLPSERQTRFRLVQVSTDEVYGDLSDHTQGAHGFSETSPYAPNSPYAASKASADHLVRAWQRTYGLPCIVTHCSNNYGPYQYPEKLVPLMILNALDGKPLPLYGSGQQIRDWLHVDDHAHALYRVAQHGQVGEVYNIGGGQCLSNRELVTQVCDLLDQLHPSPFAGIAHYRQLITQVADRPGHDRHYAIDSSKIQRELHWQPSHNLASGLQATLAWYLANRTWAARIQGDYQRQRLGLGTPPGGKI